MSSRRALPEFTPFFFAILLAAALRLIGLSSLPLSDAEATWALQALRAAEGARPALGPNPLYLLPTALSFFLFQSSNFLARLIPALAGIALAGLPWFFRKRLGVRPAAVLAFALAIDPGLTALSRQAASPLPALFFLLLAWALWLDGKPRGAGFTAGLALLGGASIWTGLLALGLGWGLSEAFERPDPETPRRSLKAALKPFRPALPYFLAALLSGGLLFLLSSNGLSAWLSALPEYMRGWVIPSGAPAGRLLLALVSYQPLALIFAGVAIVRGWARRDPLLQRLSLFALTALLLGLFYPARQTADLVWTLVPLWVLAAFELARTRLPEDLRVETLGAMALTYIVLNFAWLNLVAIGRVSPEMLALLPRSLPFQMAQLPFEMQQLMVRLALLALSMLLLILSLLLVSLGWAPPAARNGGRLGLVLALGVFTFSAAWNAAGMRVPGGAELWRTGPDIVQADLLEQTVSDLSEWNRGHDDVIPVVVVGLDSPALEWLLRDHGVTMAASLDGLDRPPMLVTAALTDPRLADAYRGQDFLWRSVPQWSPLPVDAWLVWLATRDLPRQTQTVLLWVRDDMFKDTAPPIINP